MLLTTAEDAERQRVLERATSGGAPVSPDDVTLTTHGTVSKLGQLLTQIAWWHGPVSAAIYIAGPTDIGAFVDFVDAHRGPLRATTFHVLMEKTKLLYPHNALRNLALEHAESDYFLALDGDFVPPPDAHAGLAGLIRGHAGLREGLRARTLFVLPAFEAGGAAAPRGGRRGVAAAPQQARRAPQGPRRLSGGVSCAIQEGTRSDTVPNLVERLNRCVLHDRLRGEIRALRAGLSARRAQIVD